MMLTMNLRFARWAAVSTREQLRPGKFSIPNQLEKTLEAATSRGWTETAGPFIVQGQSRETYIDLSEAEQEIPAVRQMLQAARLRQFDILVMSETDRLRSLLIQAFRRLASYQVQLYAVNLPLDPVHPNEYNIYKADHVLMMLTMSQMTSSLEISRTRRKWFENMPKRITELGLPATSIAYGYRKPPGQHLDRKAIPEPDPLISPYVIAMKDLLLSGHSIRQIIDYLVEENHVKPPKSTRWYPQTVRAILRNPFYAGVVRFGATKVVVDPLTDRRKRNRSIAPDQVQQGTGRHTPLWDMDTHQLILAELKRRGKNYRGRVNNQFTGLLRCGICGESLWRQGNGPRGEHRIMWRCSRTGGAAGHTNIPHVVLLDKIAAKLKTLTSNDARAAATSPVPDTSAQQLEDLSAQLTRLEDAYLAGKWDLDRYGQRKDQINAAIADVRRKQADKELDAAARRQHSRALDELTSIPDLPRWLTISDPAEVNQRLHFLIEHIVISEAKIEIKLK